MHRSGSSHSVGSDMNEEALSPTTQALLAIVSHRSPSTPRMRSRQDEAISRAVTRPIRPGMEDRGSGGHHSGSHYLNLVNRSRHTSVKGPGGRSKEMQTAETQTGTAQPEEDNQIVQSSSRNVSPRDDSSSPAITYMPSHGASTDTRSPHTFQDLVSCCDPNTPEVVYLNACPPSVAVAASSPLTALMEGGVASSSTNSAVVEQPSSTTGQEMVPLPHGSGSVQQDCSNSNEDLRTHTAGAQNVTTTYSIMISQQVSASTDSATRAMLDSFRTIQTIEQADSEPSPELAEQDVPGSNSGVFGSHASYAHSSSSIVAQINSPRTSQGFQPGSDICLKYPCESVGCTRAYLHKKDLIRHMRMMHNTAPQKMEATMVNVPPRPNICGVSGCMKSYIHYKDLVRHQKQVHYVALANLANIQKRYPCDYSNCSKSYIHKKDLIRHKRLFHNDTSMHPTVPEAIIVDLDELVDSSPTGMDEFELQILERSHSEETAQDEGVGSPITDTSASSMQENVSAATPTHHPTHHPTCPHHSHHTDNPLPRGHASHSGNPHSHAQPHSTAWSGDARSVQTSPVGVSTQIQTCQEGDIPTTETQSPVSTSSRQAGTASTLAEVIENTINSSSASTAIVQPTTALSPWSALLHSIDIPSPTSTTRTATARSSTSTASEGSTSEFATAALAQTRGTPSQPTANTQHHFQALSPMGIGQCSASVQIGEGTRSMHKSGMQQRHPRKQPTNVPPLVQTSPSECGGHNYKQQTHMASGVHSSQTEITRSHYKQHSHASSWAPPLQADTGTQVRESQPGTQVGRSMGLSPHATCRRRVSSPPVLLHGESTLGHYHDSQPPSPKRLALCDASVQTDEYAHPALSPYVNQMPAQSYMSSGRRADEMSTIGGHSSRYDPSLYISPGQEHGSFSPPSPRLSRCHPGYAHHQPINSPYSPRYDWSPELYETDDEGCPSVPSPSLVTCTCGRSIRPPPSPVYDHSPLHSHHSSAFPPASHPPRHSYDLHGQPMGPSHQQYPPEHYHHQLSPRMSHSRHSFDSTPDLHSYGPLESRWAMGQHRRSREPPYSSNTSHRAASYAHSSMESQHQQQQPRAVQRGNTSPTWPTSATVTSSAMAPSSSAAHYRGNPPYMPRQEQHSVPPIRTTTHTPVVPTTPASHTVSLPAASQSHTSSRTSSRQQSSHPKESERSVSPLTLRLLALTRQTMHNDFSHRHHPPN